MNSRQSDKVTRVDVRIPNHLYSQIQSIAIEHFNAKIHHRSNKPEVTPTILELLKIGIAHIESTLPVAQISKDIKTTEVLKEQIQDLDRRLSEIETLLTKENNNNIAFTAQEVSNNEINDGLSDSELGKLLNFSSTMIYHYRRDKKANPRVVEKLKNWTVKGDRWYKIDNN